jgi:hypothetical protein
MGVPKKRIRQNDELPREAVAPSLVLLAAGLTALEAVDPLDGGNAPPAK